jgi:hypothetical protein
MRHDDFDDGQLLCTVTWCYKIKQEGALEHLFTDTQQKDSEAVGHVTVCDEEGALREDTSILNEDLLMFRAQGFAIDKDNNPAPKIYTPIE